MAEQTVKEIIKSFAYGLSAKEISDNEGTSLETMQKFAEEHTADIEQKKAEAHSKLQWGDDIAQDDF